MFHNVLHTAPLSSCRSALVKRMHCQCHKVRWNLGEGGKWLQQEVCSVVLKVLVWKYTIKAWNGVKQQKSS